jgi:antirestriction protein ArdC
MATRQRTALTDEERAERRKHEQELTEQAVAQLRSSEGWQRWLTVRAQVGLRRYSVRNQCLVALQDPTATRVAGFRAWLKLGYCVRRGETSRIRVWAPCPPSKKKILAWRNAGAIATDKPRTYFRLEAVFSALQVEPLPPPAEPEPLDPPIAAVQGDTLAWAVEPLEKLADELGYSVVYKPLAEGHGGSCDPTAKVLTINSDQAVNAQVDVACHELAHALVRHDRQDEDPKLGYAEEELVAESVAHLAVSFVGLDSSASAVPYLAVWSESAAANTFERIAGLVDRLARRLEHTLGAEEAHDTRTVAAAA